MKFEEVREEYYINTEKTSELVRQLAFAGIGIVWIFFLGEKPSLSSQPYMMTPLLTLALCLLFDISQYLYASVAWERKYHEGVTKKLKLDENLSVKKHINTPTTVFFYLKIIFLILSYIMLIANLIVVAL
jgi:hypothetical protein